MSGFDSWRRVVAGVDGSEHALRAVRWAVPYASERNYPLRLVSAVGTTADHVGVSGVGWGRYRQALVESAHQRLDEATDAARSAAEERDAAAEKHAQLELTCAVLGGSPLTALRRESAMAQVLVLGHRGRGGFAGLSTGSVAVALAARAACPVVVVRDTAGALAETAPVVVGVDGSPPSEAAVCFAFDVAAKAGAPLIAVYTWLDRVEDASIRLPIDWDSVLIEERELLALRLAGWSEKYPDVTVRRLVARDQPAKLLVEQSRSARLVVLGARGRGGRTGDFLGSVSHAVLEHASCPVALVHGESHQH